MSTSRPSARRVQPRRPPPPPEGRLERLVVRFTASIDALTASSYSSLIVLTGPLADQGALRGVLDLLFMLNLPLIRVERYNKD